MYGAVQTRRPLLLSLASTQWPHTHSRSAELAARTLSVRRLPADHRVSDRSGSNRGPRPNPHRWGSRRRAYFAVPVGWNHRGPCMPQTPDPTISLQSVLLGDVVRALTFEPRDDSTRRATMHAFCAAIEGILWMLQCDLLSVATQELSNSQRAILREKPHILRENGKVGRVPSKVNLRQRVQFSAAVVAALRPNCEIQFEAAGWSDLLATLDVRDRLGHPEKESDLDVTDAELEAARHRGNLVSRQHNRCPTNRTASRPRKRLLHALGPKDRSPCFVAGVATDVPNPRELEQHEGNHAHLTPSAEQAQPSCSRPQARRFTRNGNQRRRLAYRDGHSLAS